ncbi:hypothetical protein [Fusobacterium ulcerans]|uniref:hypothetical protein n=1 Tax=Fusobacterium ulcerans TaxID=861 RepID=UPI001559103E|nr:hypothetical protein [Fusobacterium ulcerans]
MTKSNKELAVDIALKYIEATGTEGKAIVKPDILLDIIKKTYKTLEELDKTKDSK